MISLTQRIDSVEAAARIPESARYRMEVSGGFLVREPRPAALHGVVVMNVIVLLHEQQKAGRGRVIAEAGFRLDESPLVLRGPDAAFIVKERLPAAVPEGFWTIPPDLAVEVVSPANSASDIQAKVLDYLNAGVALLWVIDPRSRSVMVYHSRSSVRLLTEQDTLDGGTVLPDFSTPVAALFDY